MKKFEVEVNPDHQAVTVEAERVEVSDGILGFIIDTEKDHTYRVAQFSRWTFWKEVV